MDKSSSDQEETESNSGRSSGEQRVVPLRYTKPQGKTGSFEQLVSDEVTIARAMMSRDSDTLHSLSEQQRERVMQLRRGIEVVGVKKRPSHPPPHPTPPPPPQSSPVAWKEGIGDHKKVIEKLGFAGWWSGTPPPGQFVGDRARPSKPRALDLKVLSSRTPLAAVQGPHGKRWPGRPRRFHPHASDASEKAQAISTTPIEDHVFHIGAKKGRQGGNNTSRVCTEDKERENEKDANLSSLGEQGRDPLVNRGNSYLQAFKQKNKGEMSDTNASLVGKEGEQSGSEDIAVTNPTTPNSRMDDK